MPSSYTTSLRFELQFTGENLNLWGDKLNAALARADDAIAGWLTKPLTGNYVLTTANGGADEARRAMLKFAGTGAFTVTVPAVAKRYDVWNACAGDLTLTNGSASVVVKAGEVVAVVTDGAADFRRVQATDFGGATLTNVARVAGLSAPSANGDAATKKYVDDTAFSAVGGTLPGQSGNAGAYLKTDGSVAGWAQPTKADVGLGNVDNTAVLGKHAIWVPASAMTPRTTNGGAAGLAETTTNKVMLRTLDFDRDTVEYAQFAIRMPKSWNEGVVTFVPEWSHGIATTNFKVSWGLQGVSVSDGESIDSAFGTAQYSNDTGGAADAVYAGSESSAITVAGAPAAEDLVVFQVLRKADDGINDTLAVDARLHGLTLFITTNAGTDA